MSKITNRIAKVLSVVSSDLPIYVAGDEELVSDIRNGWPNRRVEQVASYTRSLEERGLLIAKDDYYVVKY